ncbi:site-specific integrase [Pseudomonas profundi]|uniref:site-specific integrase n=1 Tax=Pseudomonas profundi TaxID=1981513 RepID=UPI00123B3964|nr:site-specific integrase [Pseudomonas profundi]
MSNGCRISMGIRVDVSRQKELQNPAGRAQVQKQLANWTESVLGSRKKLLKVELAQKGRLAVSATYLSDITGLGKESLYTLNEMPEVIQAMTDEGIIIEGYNVLDCDKRRRLICWYEGLEDEQKLAVEIHAGQAKHRGYLDQIPVLRGIRPSKLYNLTRTEIGGDVLKRRAEVALPPVRVGHREIKRRVHEWREDVVSSRQKLLDVQLKASGPPAVSIPYLSELLGVSKSALNSSYDMPEVIDAMTNEKIILPGYRSSECEKRRKLLRWYGRLSQEEKLSIPLYGNRIKKKGYLDQLPEFKRMFTTSMSGLINLTIREISEDLVRAGLGPSNYKTVQEREQEKARSPKAPKPSPLKRFFELRAISVRSLADLSVSSDIPFSPLLHLFAAGSMESHSESGQRNYFEAWRRFTRCLTREKYKGYEPVVTMLGEHSLTRFRKYLAAQLQEGLISTSVATTDMSATRKMLESAKAVEGLALDGFHPAPGFDVSRETDLYAAYSPTERMRISEAIQADIARIHDLAQPYVRTGVGEDPYDGLGNVKRGMGTLEIARWIFENKLNCVPINYSNLDKNDKYHKYFRNMIDASSLSIFEIYESWGVLYDRSSKVLAPYIARLAQVTGLNADSIATLQIDDFVSSHPLSQRPCLRYWKERSTGEKEYHLDIFKAEISWLTTSQAREIKRIIEDVTLITSTFRAEADPSIKNDLFIYKSSSRRAYGAIKSISGRGGTLNVALRKFAVRHNLLTDAGEPLSLSPSRFRPSFVSELIEQDVSVREIQVMLGHENIETTLNYLERMDFNRIAREKLDGALRKIHSETLIEKLAAPIANSDVPVQDGIIFKTPLGGCRNIMNPPDFIKRLRSYVPGKPCSLYNKCLSCDNNIITRSDLPELYAMRKDYMRILQVSRLADTPYGGVVLENLALLESILTPGRSDFSEEELNEAGRLSEYVDTNIVIEGVGL